MKAGPAIAVVLLATVLAWLAWGLKTTADRYDEAHRARFDERCAAVGFTPEQCAFFHQGGKEDPQ